MSSSSQQSTWICSLLHYEKTRKSQLGPCLTLFCQLEEQSNFMMLTLSFGFRANEEVKGGRLPGMAERCFTSSSNNSQWQLHFWSFLWILILFFSKSLPRPLLPVKIRQASYALRRKENWQKMLNYLGKISAPFLFLTSFGEPGSLTTIRGAPTTMRTQSPVHKSFVGV